MTKLKKVKSFGIGKFLVMALVLGGGLIYGTQMVQKNQENRSSAATGDLNESCEPGKYTCQNNVLKKCLDTKKYNNGYNCGSQKVCDASTGDCVSKDNCETGKFMCDGNVLKRCLGTKKWNSGYDCGDKLTCDAKTGHCIANEKYGPSDNCKPDTYYCDNNILKKCLSTKNWNNGNNCGDDAVCNSTTGSCAPRDNCKPGTFNCDNNILKRCLDNGNWNDGFDCGDKTVCDVTKGGCSAK